MQSEQAREAEVEQETDSEEGITEEDTPSCSHAVAQSAAKSQGAFAHSDSQAAAERLSAEEDAPVCSHASADGPASTHGVSAHKDGQAAAATLKASAPGYGQGAHVEVNTGRPAGSGSGSGGDGGVGGERSASGAGEASRVDREEFLELMRARFLAGLDDLDYNPIDSDRGLDEDFRDLAEQDAQDKYFDSD